MALGLRTYRPLISGRTHMAAAGHYLATAAAYRILEQGGNATDAGVAAGIALNVTLPQYTSFGGVAPIMIHDAARGETVTIAGLGRWPRAASVDYFEANHGGQLPGGVLRTAPAPNAPVLARVEAGAVLLVEEERAGYVRVRQPPASAVGWLERGQVLAVEETDGRNH